MTCLHPYEIVIEFDSGGFLGGWCRDCGALCTGGAAWLYPRGSRNDASPAPGPIYALLREHLGGVDDAALRLVAGKLAVREADRGRPEVTPQKLCVRCYGDGWVSEEDQTGTRRTDVCPRCDGSMVEPAPGRERAIPTCPHGLTTHVDPETRKPCTERDNARKAHAAWCATASACNCGRDDEAANV